MIEAGAIGARFTVVDEASSVLERIAAQFERMDGIIRQVKEAMLSIVMPPEVTAQIGRLNEQMVAIGGAADKGASAAVTAFGTLDTSIDGAIDRVKALKIEMASVGKVAAVDDMVPVAAGGRRRPPGAYGPNGERLPEESHGGGRGGMFGGHHNPLRSVGRAFGAPSELLDAAFSPGGLGVAGVAYLAVEAAKEGARMAHEATVMSIGGVSSDEVKKATDASLTLGQKYGFKADKVAAMLNEIRVPLNNGAGADSGMEAALGVSDSLMQFATVARAVAGPEKGGQALDQLYSAIKAGELRNVTDPAKYADLISAEAQVFAGTGGRVTPNDMQTALKYMRTEGMTVSDDYVKYELPAVIQEFKASTAGQMLAGAYQTFIGSHNQKKAIAEGKRIGLYDEQGRFKFADDLLTDPTKAFGEIGDVLKSKGITDEKGIAEEIGLFTSNRNTAEIVAKGILGATQLQRTSNSIRASMDAADAAKVVGAKDPMQAMDRITAGLANLGAAFSGPQMTGITSGLNSFADALNAAIGPAKHLGEDLAGFDAWISAHTIPKMLGAPESNIGPDGKPITNSVSIPAAILPSWLTGGPALISNPAAAVGGSQAATDAAANATRALDVAASIPVPAMPQIDPGIYERSRRASDAYRADPEAARARALSAMVPNVGLGIQGSLQTLPGQVQPAITSAFASIGAAISSAIAGLASSAKAAAGAIQTGGKTTQVQSTTVLNVDGRKLSEAVGSHIITANASVNNSAAADTTSMAGWPDMQSYA